MQFFPFPKTLLLALTLVTAAYTPLSQAEKPSPAQIVTQNFKTCRSMGDGSAVMNSGRYQGFHGNSLARGLKMTVACYGEEAKDFFYSLAEHKEGIRNPRTQKQKNSFLKWLKFGTLALGSPLYF